MKKILILILVIIFCSSCEEMSISNSKYEEVSDFVMKNKDDISVEKNIKFFDFKTTGLSVGGVYYGYYYSFNNEIVVPDFYTGNNLGEKFEADGGTYFGKPNNGTDFCFVKKIIDNWYYFELHWS